MKKFLLWCGFAPIWALYFHYAGHTVQVSAWWSVGLLYALSGGLAFLNTAVLIAGFEEPAKGKSS